jgi:hypothetical protein
MRRKRRTTKMKSELGQSMDHLKRAASLAAQGTSATVGPTISSARGAASSGWDSAVATITPLVAAASDTVRQSGKDASKAGRKSVKASKRDAKKLEKRANKALNRKQGGRKGKLFGIALVGAAVGLAAAAVMRKRQAAQWDEYDPAPAEPVGADDAAFEPTTTTPVPTPPVNRLDG